MAKQILEAGIVKIGANAADFLEENMLIFFQEDVPPYLADFCYLSRPSKGGYGIQVGDRLILDGESFPVTAIGDVALENFEKLGHLTVRFDGAAAPAQPGTMHVGKGAVPALHAGSSVVFVRDEA